MNQKKQTLIYGTVTNNRNDYEIAERMVTEWFNTHNNDRVVFCSNDVGGIAVTVRKLCHNRYITCCVVYGPVGEISDDMDEVVILDVAKRRLSEPETPNAVRYQ